MWNICFFTINTNGLIYEYPSARIPGGPTDGTFVVASVVDHNTFTVLDNESGTTDIDPQALANAKLAELSELLMPLGMQYKRAATLKRFSQEYIDGFNDPIDLHGIGKYAKDSWEIFQNNNLNVRPTDKVLNLYLATALEMQTEMGHS